MRKECFNCHNTIEEEGDAFCSECEGTHFMCSVCGGAFHDSLAGYNEDDWICKECFKKEQE